MTLLRRLWEFVEWLLGSSVCPHCGYPGEHEGGTMPGAIGCPNAPWNRKERP